jgi:hypothetical protein
LQNLGVTCRHSAMLIRRRLGINPHRVMDKSHDISMDYGEISLDFWAASVAQCLRQHTAGGTPWHEGKSGRQSV